MEDGVYFSLMDDVQGEEFFLLLMLKLSFFYFLNIECIVKMFMCDEVVVCCRVWVFFVVV